MNEETRILVATGLYPPDIGGPATYTKMLEAHLPPDRFTLVVHPFGQVRHLPKMVRHLAYTWQLIRKLRQADLVYALDPVSVGLPALIASWVTKRPIFLRLGGDYAWEQGQNRYGVTDLLDEFIARRSTYPWPVRILHAVQSFVAKRVRLINVQSHYMKSIVTTWGVKPDRIKVINSVLHPIEISEKRESLREMFDYNGLVITTSGRLVPWKGMDTLIRCMPDLKARLGDVTLVIIGDGPLAQRLTTLAEELGVEHSVRLVGRQPKDTMGAAIYASDLFVLNTAYEGLSHQLLEVMSLGVPIVSTNIAANRELLEDGVTGLLVDYDDRQVLTEAVIRLSESSELGKRLAGSARLRVQDFGIDRVIDEISTFLETSNTSRT